MTSPTITALARTTLLTATLGLLSLSQAHAQSLIIEPGTTAVEPSASFSLTVSGKDFDTAIVGGGFNLSFDPTILRLDSMTIPSSWEFFRSTGLLDAASGTVTDVSFNTFTAPKAGTFEAATLFFTAVGTGTSQVTLSASVPYVFADVDVNTVTPSFGSATVTVSAVPEPASLALLLAGAGVMALARRRQG
ncbi:MAG: hypothetical protein RLZZ182_1265 [Pseudomonadota bacterium]